MSGPKRRILIPAIRDMIVRACPLAPSMVDETIDKWTAGDDVDTPVEKAVFAVIDQIAADIDAQEEKAAAVDPEGGDS